MKKYIFQFGHFIRYNDYCNRYIVIGDYTKADMSSIISNVNIPEYINFAGAAFVSSYIFTLCIFWITYNQSILKNNIYFYVLFL